VKARGSADPRHEIAQTKIFGPVLLMFRFSTEDEAVELETVSIIEPQ